MVVRRSGKIIKRKIMYPIFAKCANYTLDRYYLQILENCSTGIFPKGMYVKNDSLYAVSSQHTAFHHKYPSHHTINISLVQSPKKLLPKLIILFQNNINLMFSKEQNKKNAYVENLYDKYIRYYSRPWGKWSKYSRERSIINFILRVAMKLKLSLQNTEELFSLIQLSFQFGWLVSSDVIVYNLKDQLKDGSPLLKKDSHEIMSKIIRIKKICKLRYNKTSKIFTVEEMKKKDNTQKIKDQVKIKDKWGKYRKILRKQYEKMFFKIQLE